MDLEEFKREAEPLEKEYLGLPNKNLLGVRQFVGRAVHELRTSWRRKDDDADGMWFFVGDCEADGLYGNTGYRNIVGCGMFWVRDLLDDASAVWAIADRYAPRCPVLGWKTVKQEKCGLCGGEYPVIVNYRQSVNVDHISILRSLYVLCVRCPALYIFGMGEQQYLI